MNPVNVNPNSIDTDCDSNRSSSSIILNSYPDNSPKTIQTLLPSSANNVSVEFSSKQAYTEETIDDYRDYVCGFGAAVVNIYVTFPINKIIFRQMLHGQSVRGAVGNLRAEGIRHLYRGVGPPLIQRSISLSLMFGTFGTYHRLLDSYADSVIPSSYGRFSLAAFLAGSTEAILCPFERIQMLLQDDRKHHMYSNTIDAFKKLRSFGITEYYRGLSAILLRNGPSNILFFTLRDEVKKLFPESSHGAAHNNNNNTTGTATTTTTTTATATKSAFEPETYNSSSISSQPPQSFRNVQSSSLQRSQQQHSILVSDLLRDFICGSCIGAMISTIFYPINVVRTQMQTQQPGNRHLNVYEAFQIIYHQRDRKFSKLFRGFHVNYTRSFLSWGIINACYEMFHKMLNKDDELDQIKQLNNASQNQNSKKSSKNFA